MTAVVLRGDAAHLPLPDGSADLVLCSPPYWSLREYRDGGQPLAGQIGSEETPQEYLAALWACTREWARVLKPGGSIFVNLSDVYAARADAAAGRTWREDRADALPSRRNTTGFVSRKSLMGLPGLYAAGCTGALAALGGIDTGLRLTRRADIAWRKNGQPESVRDRVQCEHESIFHFTRQARYYSACDVIREPLAAPGRKAGASAFGARNANHERTATGGYDGQNPLGQNPLGRIPGSVWDIPAEPLTIPERIAHARCCGGRKRPGCEDGLRHDAAWPTALARRIILGWSPPGICAECGEGRRPVASAVSLDMARPQARRARQLADRAGLTEDHFRALLSVGVSDTGRGAATQTGTGKNTPAVYALAAEARTALGGYAREYLLRRPTELAYACGCPSPDAPVDPAVVADPFGGVGTSALVASALGRVGVSIDRGMDYSRLAVWRTSDPGERARALGVPKPPPVPEGQGSLFDQLGEAS